MTISKMKTVKITIIAAVILMAGISLLNGQAPQKYYIRGQLKDQLDMQPVSFVTVALRRLSDSTLLTGVASNSDGEFSFESLPAERYSLEISAIGYNRLKKEIDLKDNVNSGVILLQPRSVSLDEVVVVADRIKARASAESTTYYINKKIYEATDNTIDLIRYIPGVQVDLLRNISLEGSRNIIILVDGKERDKNFLGQLNPAKIDKVEVLNTPGPGYDANITGVIKILLKKDKVSGVEGHIHAEIPTRRSEIYLFPDYSISYGFKKFNFFTSYNAELSYFDIEGNDNWSNQDLKIISNQVLNQKDWSHRFHYGFDYIINEKNQLNFYSYWNPYSYEMGGNVDLYITREIMTDKPWVASKRDKDMNRASFYSLYFRHSFDKPGKELIFDLSYLHFKAENSTTYSSADSIGSNMFNITTNSVKPLQNAVSLKIDFNSPVAEKISLNSGIKIKSQWMSDRLSDEFRYDEKVFAGYVTLTANFSKYTLSAGIRGEKSLSGLTGRFSNDLFALLPSVYFNYKISSKANLKLSYTTTAYRPGMYELNPAVTVDNPHTTRSGNPELRPEIIQKLSANFSRSINDNFMSFQLFYNRRNEVINYYTFLNDSDMFITGIANCGDIHELGIQVSGSFKLHKSVTFNPYFKLYGLNYSVNALMKQYGITDGKKAGFESGLSAIINFNHGFAASLQFQYNSPKPDIQRVRFSDALYFVSVEKTFRKNFRAGIMSALPFSKRFTYYGEEIRSNSFYYHSERNIRFSAIPFWFKLDFRFNSGKKINKIDRTKEEVDNKRKNGF
jgi:hypothetical protein